MLDSVDDSQLNYGNVIFTAGYNYQMSRTEHDWTFLSVQCVQLQQLRPIHKEQHHRGVVWTPHHRQARFPSVWRTGHCTHPNAAYNRVTGSWGETGTTTSGSITQVYGSFNAALQYQIRASRMSAAYNHGVSGGSGVLAGAVTDNVYRNSGTDKYHEHSMWAGMLDIHETAG